MFEMVYFFLVSFQFRLNLTCYESLYQTINMQVLSLEGCSLCGSQMRALPGLSLILRMFSPLLPSLPFQACQNCSQLVCVYTDSYRMYGILKIKFTHWNSTLDASWWSLVVFLCFQMGKMQLLIPFTFPRGICSSPNFCEMEEFFPPSMISLGKEKSMKILSC